MGIFTAFTLIAICAISLYVIIYFVVGPKPDLWAEIFILALIITLVEVSRNFIPVFTANSWAVFIARIIIAFATAAILYFFAHFRLGLERQKKKLLIAFIYPGIKLILYIIIIGVSR